MTNPLIGHYKDREVKPEKVPLSELGTGAGYSLTLSDPLQAKDSSDVYYPSPTVYPWYRVEREHEIAFVRPESMVVRVPFEDLEVGEVFRPPVFGDPMIKIGENAGLMWTGHGWTEGRMAANATVVPMDPVEGDR